MPSKGRPRAFHVRLDFPHEISLGNGIGQLMNFSYVRSLEESGFLAAARAKIR